MNSNNNENHEIAVYQHLNGRFAHSSFLFRSQAAQAHYLWVRASEVIWSEYTRIISVLSDAK